MPTADGNFISLAELLRSAAPAAGPAISSIVEPFVPAHAAPPERPILAAPSYASADPCGCERSEALRDARIFRAALADALAALAEDLMRRLGADVLGRELQLAPADVETIARRLLLERRTDEPLRLRVAAADSAIACDVPVVVDPELAAGDAILECRSGDIDARLAVRLGALFNETIP